MSLPVVVSIVGGLLGAVKLWKSSKAEKLLDNLGWSRLKHSALTSRQKIAITAFVALTSGLGMWASGIPVDEALKATLSIFLGTEGAYHATKTVRQKPHMVPVEEGKIPSEMQSIRTTIER